MPSDKRSPCVCGHGHALIEGSDPPLFNKHCWAYYVNSRCECNSHRPPVDPYYRHEPGRKPKAPNRSPGENDNRGRNNDHVRIPMALPISDAMLADPEFGTAQTMTLEQYRRLYGENVA